MSDAGERGLPPDPKEDAIQPVSGPGVLYNGAGNGYWYDATAQRIHMKIVAGGTGSTIFDGTRTVFAVGSHQ